MRKTISLIVIALFVLSVVPLALAEDTQEQSAKDKIESVRENLKQVRETAKENYKETVEQYKDAKEKFKEARDNIKGSREKLKECVGLKTDECNNIRSTVKTNAKPFLQNSGEAILKLLENLKNKVQASNLGDEEKLAMIAEIDANVAKINEAKSSADSLGENATNEEIKQSAKEMRETWKEVQKDIKITAGELVHFRVGEIVKKSEQLENRLNQVIDKAKANGKDTTALQSLVDQFKQKVADARQKYEEAKQKYTEAKSAGNTDEVVKEANQLLKEAHKDLKEAHSILKSIVKELRGKNAEKELEETKTKDNEQESSEETVETEDNTEETAETEESSEQPAQETTEEETIEVSGTTGDAVAI